LREVPLAAATPAPRRQIAPASRWVIAGIVATGSVSSLLSTTVVTVAVSDLQHVFNAPLNDVQWVLTAYLLGLSATIPLSGWATDRFGAKRMYLTTLIAFTLASALCGLAWNIGSEVAFRVIQGLAGGMVMPIGMAILMQMTPANERGRMMSFLGVPMMLAPALGPTIGGLLIKLVDWRLIFWINIPVGVLAVYLAWRRMNESERVYPGRFDLVGFLTCTPGVALVIFGLTQASANGWGSWKTLIPLVAAAALLVFFTLWELRQEAGPEQRGR
jgi:EmrB/QacA subfamily drug resistance transporter